MTTSGSALRVLSAVLIGFVLLGLSSRAARAQCFGACWYTCGNGSGLAISCNEPTPTGCTASGGVFQGCGTNCSTGPGACCRQACCLGATCVNGLLPAECTTQGGSSEGVCSTCENLIGGGCFRACCMPNQTCTEYRPNDCTALGGIPYPAAEGCTAGITCRCDADIDFDGDGRRGSCDCNEGNASIWARPGEVMGLTAVQGVSVPGDVRIGWNSLDASAGTGTNYDVARGFLLALHSLGYPGGAGCAFNDAADTPYDESAASCSPAPSNGCWYLVRAQNACGTGTYGTGTNGNTLDTASPCP